MFQNLKMEEERERKGRERKLKKEEFMGIKLKLRRRISTPSPTWNFPSLNPNSSLSARKLGAKLRQIQPNMSHGGPRRSHHRQKDKGFQPDSLTQQPTSASSLRRYIAATLIQNHRSSGHLRDLQTVSPASYASSSLEVAPYNPSVTTTSSMDFNGRIGEGNYNIKTSNELLKVLNRIWTLEEQHASNSSLVMKMKKELHNSQAQIKELLQEKKKTNDDQEWIQSMRKEIEDERKLRKHSESIHRKLARELLETKSSISNAIKEKEKERKSRVLLENLCDEFAKGIRDYEHEIRLMKQKPNKERVIMEKPERLILHISESWLDERMQMKLGESESNSVEKNSIVDKLSSEIETFLQSKKSKKHLSESFNLNEAISGPQNEDRDEDSCGSGSNCFELNRDSSGKQRNICSKTGEHSQQIVVMNPMKKKIQSGAVTGNISKNHNIGQENPVEVKILQKEGNFEVTQGGRGNSTNLTRNHSCSIERLGFSGDDPTVEQWRSKITSADPEVSECSSKWVRGIKENTLKAKLLEARLEGQHYRSRTSKGSFS